MTATKRAIIRVILGVVASASVLASLAGAQVMRAPETTGRAKVNDVALYYEVHGSGPPLVLLHGGVTPSDMFGAPLTEMAKSHKVIAIHARGHGFSTDTDRPWSHEMFADDVAALMRELGIGRASVVGYSSGADIAVQTAIRHPQLVDRLIVIAAGIRTDGYFPEVLKAFADMPSAAAAYGEAVSKSPLGALYPEANWERIFRKTADLANQPHDWSSAVAGIKAPTLLVFADADAIRPEHMVEFYKLLGGGQREAGLDGSLRSPNQLAIIPNTTHYNILASPALTQFATAFLNQR